WVGDPVEAECQLSGKSLIGRAPSFAHNRPVNLQSFFSRRFFIQHAQRKIVADSSIFDSNGKLTARTRSGLTGVLATKQAQFPIANAGFRPLCRRRIRRSPCCGNASPGIELSSRIPTPGLNGPV